MLLINFKVAFAQRQIRSTRVTLADGIIRDSLGVVSVHENRESQELQTSPVRVLVVDDFELWQTFVHNQLDREPNLRVIAVAGDGLEAVRKAKELQPDLIVLDIGLPKLNGIEAARRIRKAAPRSKILVLSANADPELVKAAFSAGALGYVHKSAAAQSLLPAMEAVLRGKRFVACSRNSFEDLT